LKREAKRGKVKLDATDHFQSVYSCSCDSCTESDSDHSVDCHNNTATKPTIIPEVNESFDSGQFKDSLPYQKSQTSSSKTSSQDSSEENNSFDSNDYAKLFNMREFYNFEPLYLDKNRLSNGRFLHVI
jgi:hypothetical protein